jgi:hypothetical protein
MTSVTPQLWIWPACLVASRGVTLSIVLKTPPLPAYSMLVIRLGAMP